MERVEVRSVEGGDDDDERWRGEEVRRRRGGGEEEVRRGGEERRIPHLQCLPSGSSPWNPPSSVPNSSVRSAGGI